MQSLSVLAALLATVVVAVPTPDLLNHTRPVVNLDYARVEGVLNETLGLKYFYGIRYAAPPTGNLRWQAPEPIEDSDLYKPHQLLDASVAGPICYQGVPWSTSLNVTASQFTGQSEDCLLLDIWAPANPKNKKLPVTVYIHGGGYTLGSAQSGQVPTQYSDGNIIFVSIQYRLGAFGFLSNSNIQEDGSANTGLLDQRLAIEWTQRHISKFGGDPAKITIWGGSAGGGSVMNQLILYGGQNPAPFRGAIPEFPWFQPYHNMSILDAQYNQLLEASGCTSLACLRGLSSIDLAIANQKTFAYGFLQGLYAFGDFYYGPAVDGEIVQDLPSNEFKKGHFSKVAMLVDRDGYEGVVFTSQTITSLSQVTPDLQTLFPYAGPSFFTRLYELYPASDFTGSYFDLPFFQNYIQSNPNLANDTGYWQRAAIFGDFIIECPTSYMASALTDAGLPAYKLAFYAGTQLHGATGAFVFSTDSASPNATIAGYMKDWFLSFIIDLDVNTRSFSGLKGKPRWPTFGASIDEDASAVSSFNAMEVNVSSIAVVADPDTSDRCDFFHAQSYVVRN